MSTKTLLSQQPSSSIASSSSHSSAWSSTESDMSTPHKSRTSSLQDWRVDSANQSIGRELQGNYATKIPLLDFVKNVFGLDESVVSSFADPGLNVKYPSNGNADAYRRLLTEKKEGEACLYPRFLGLVKDLLPAVFDIVKEQRPDYGKAPYEPELDELLKSMWQGNGATYIKHGYAVRKPDVLLLNGPPPASWLADPDWILVKHPGEFKKRDRNSSKSRKKPGTLSRSVQLKNVMSSAGSSIAPSGSSQFTFTFGTDDSTPSTGSKRARDESSTSTRGPVSKRPRTEENPSKDQCQLTGYAIECLGSTNRFYNVAFFVDNSRICLTYVDRMVSFRSEWIDFLKNPHQFALIICSLFMSSPRQAGHNPFLQTTPVTELDNGASLPQIFPSAASLIGSFFVYKYPGSDADDKVLQPTSGGKQLFCNFEIIAIIYKPRGLFGRVTAVYRTRATFPDRCVDNVALKGSWQLAIRDEESKIIKHLRKEISDFKAHLPEVLYSAVFGEEELQLPSFRMVNIHGIDFEKRKLHILASPMYQKLWEVRTVEEFKKVWLDAFKCHHAAWKRGKVLHRDVSENNIMFLRRFFKNDETVVGILNDWDMASFLDEAYNLRQSTAKHRTGTLPFMSELLLFSDVEDSDDEEEECQTVHHSYCHDVESFFWVLLWAFIHYPLDGTRRKTPDSLSQWISDDTEIVSFWKHAVLTKKKAVFNRMLRQHALPHFQELRRDWLVPLYDLIAASRLTAPKVELTYEAVMEAIGEEA